MNSNLYYGPIVLTGCKIRVRRQTVLAGYQYLNTANTIAVEGIYNPSLNSLQAIVNVGGSPARALAAARQAAAFTSQFGGPRVNQRAGAFAGTAFAQEIASPQSATAVVGSPAPVTDVAIRHVLMQARQKLIVELGGFVIIEQPAPGFVTDAGNGPTPLECNITRIEGTKTFFIEFVIQTAINEFYGNNREAKTAAGGYGAPNLNLTGGYSANGGAGQAGRQSPSDSSIVSPLVAHEWTMKHVIDADFFTTRYIIGRAIFRGDIMQKFGIVPDQLRAALFHPVPANMRRQQIEVTALPDGNTIQYSVVDRQRALIYDPNLITRVEASLAISDEAKSIENAIAGIPTAGTHASGASLDLIGGVAATGLDLGRRLGRMLVGYDKPQDAFKGFALLPSRTYKINISAWGQPNSNPAAIKVAILKIVTDATSQIPQLVSALGGFSKSWHTDLSGRFVNYQETAYTGLTGRLTDNIDNAIGDFVASTKGEALRTAASLPLDIHPSNPSRGSYLGACVAQVLRDTATPWNRPTDPGNVVRKGNVVVSTPIVSEIDEIGM